MYTLAILLAERMGTFGFRNIRIDATDIDETDQFASIVRDASYSPGEVERIPGSAKAKYFQKDADGKMRLVEQIRERVNFRKHDLLSLQPAGTGYSLIVCKNVLLHFQPEQRAEVIRMFHAALQEGGYLVLEHTQKLPPTTESLFRQVTSNAQLFTKLDA